MFAYKQLTFLLISTYFLWIKCCCSTVTITGQHASFTDPDVKHLQFPIILQAITVVKCDEPVSTIFQNWQAFLVDETTGLEISNLNLDGFSPDKNQLTVDPYFLTPGLFKFSFNLASNTVGCNANETQSTYIKFTPSDLIVVLVPGPFPKTLINAITIVPNDILTLQPSLFSFFPHMQTSDLLRYANIKYYCRQLSEKYPNNLDGVTVGPDGNVTLPGTGCFNQGPGRLNLQGGVVSIEASKLIIGCKCEFRADVYVSEDKFFSGKVHVTVMDGVGYSPTLKISPHKPNLVYQTQTTMKVSVQDKLIVKSFCDKNGPCYDVANVQFLWTVFSHDLDYKPVICNDLALYSVGHTYYQITIFGDFFMAHKNLTQFGITLQMNSTGNPTVESSIYIELNAPPTAGSCSVTPAIGNVLSKFTFSCSGWKDEDGIHAYIFYQNESARQDIAVSYWETTFSAHLPLGSKDKNFSYVLWVDVVDNYGATETVSLGAVTVTVSPNTSYCAIQKQLDELRRFENSPEFVSLTSAYLSLANYEANNFGLMECVLCTFNTVTNAANYLSVWDYSCDTFISRIDNTICSGEEQKCLQLIRSKNAETRSNLVRNALAATSSTLPHNIGVSLSLIRHLAVDGAGQEITLELVDSLTDTFVHATKSFDAHANRVGPKYSRQTTEQILVSIGHALKSFSKSFLSPVDYDHIAARQQLYDDYDGSLPKNPDDIKYWEKMNAKERGVNAAEVYFMKKGESLAKAIVQLLYSIKLNVINDITPGESSYHFDDSNSGVEILLNVQSVKYFEQNQTLNGKNFKLILPQLSNLVNNFHTLDDVVLSIVHFDGNVFKFADKNRLLTSGSTEVELTNFRSMKEISVANSNFPVELFQNLQNSESINSLNTVVPVLQIGSIMKYHSIKIGNQGSVVVVHLNKTKDSSGLKMFLQLDTIPGPSPNEHLFSEIIQPYSGPYRLKVDEALIGSFIGTIYIGVAQLSDNTSFDAEIQRDNYDYQFRTNYTLKFQTTSCNYFDISLRSWSFEGCRVGPLTTFYQSHCLCNHLTSFASGLIVPPNTIDFNYVFLNANFSKNITIYMTLFVTFCVYFLLMLYAREADKRDVIKLGVTPLVDNDELDKYYYEIIVSTGMHRDSATDSNIYFVLEGEKHSTSVRNLSDPQRPSFRRGQVNRFVMAVPKTLGDLNLLRIWHDNSGKGLFASWYLNYVIFVDMQTQTKYFFLLDKWLSVEKDDCKIDKSIPVATEQEMFAINTLFGAHSRRNFSDNHLWLSIFLRPPNSRFTRCQRTTCCLILLFTVMLVSAMWYDKTNDAPLSHYLSFGFFRISIEEIGVGFFSNLIVFPINFILVILFRYSRQRTSHLNVLTKATEKSCSASDSTSTDWSDLLHQTSPANESSRPFRVSAMPDSEHRKKSKKFSLPWWFRILTWALCVCIILICTFFLLAYAIQFGDLKTRKWLTSLMISVITSVFLTQPLKIILVVCFVSCLCKKDLSEDDEELYVLENDEQYLHAPNNLPKIVPCHYYDKKRVDKAKEWRNSELKLYDVLRELFVYCIFLLIVLIVTNRDPWIPVYRRHMNKVFVDGPKLFKRSNFVVLNPKIALFFF